MLYGWNYYYQSSWKISVNEPRRHLVGPLELKKEETKKRKEVTKKKKRAKKKKNKTQKGKKKKRRMGFMVETFLNRPWSDHLRNRKKKRRKKFCFYGN
jgi:hypothetical protein